MNARPQPCTQAPALSAEAVGGEYVTPATVTLAALTGQTVALCFYPQDGAPGCTNRCGCRLAAAVTAAP